MLFVALAGAGCETLESGSAGAVVAPTSPWPASTTGSSTHAGGSGFAAGLSGQWFQDGKPTSIKVDPDGRNLMIINENGQRSSGYANSPSELEIPSLRIKGRVGDGGRRISWNMAQRGLGNHTRADLILGRVLGRALADAGIMTANRRA